MPVSSMIEALHNQLRLFKKRPIGIEQALASSFSRTVLEWLHNNKIPDNEQARRLGITQEYLEELYHLDARPSLKKMSEILHAMGFTADDIPSQLIATSGESDDA